jgi:hypothetical protein
MVGENRRLVHYEYGFSLMAGPNFQPSDGNPIVISILRQLVNGPDNAPEM